MQRQMLSSHMHNMRHLRPARHDSDMLHSLKTAHSPQICVTIYWLLVVAHLKLVLFLTDGPVSVTTSTPSMPSVMDATGQFSRTSSCAASASVMAPYPAGTMQCGPP